MAAADLPLLPVLQDGSLIGLGPGPINLDELVGKNLFRYEAQCCRKPSGFQRIATTLPGKVTLYFRNAKRLRSAPSNRSAGHEARILRFSLQLIAVCRANSINLMIPDPKIIVE
ncbi:hypothetical protein BKI51_06440 [Alphaproteobacteria bacterium AO1-B]|nr:hypothetical protein BKI51_06440 [Alphaproteobacteria bacterium AO1-B]